MIWDGGVEVTGIVSTVGEAGAAADSRVAAVASSGVT